MKKHKKLFFLLTLLLNFHTSKAQIEEGASYYKEAFLLSQYQLAGSARFQAIGGASTALGGDISSAFSNPAGLGFIRKANLVFSPAINYNSSQSQLFFNPNSPNQGTNESFDLKMNLNFNQIGICFTDLKDENEKGY